MKKIKSDEISSVNDFGNEILYTMCKNYPNHDDEKVIAGKAWLIGRSYAVSPQRRKKQKEENVKEKSYDFFFDNYGKNFLSCCNGLDKRLNSLKQKKYNNNLDSDLMLIKNEIQIIYDFNEMVVKTVKQIDKVNENFTEQIRNNISFSSKYLHFHCPHLFFIFDSYSYDSARKFSQCFKKKHNLDNSCKKLIKALNLENDKILPLIRHYLICYLISMNVCENKTLTPREVDTFLLKKQWSNLV